MVPSTQLTNGEIICFFFNLVFTVPELDLQIKRIESLNQAYALELEIICEEFDLERSILIEQHANDMACISDIIFAMEEEFQIRENEAQAEYQSMRDEIKNKVRIFSSLLDSLEFILFSPISDFIIIFLSF